MTSQDFKKRLGLQKQAGRMRRRDEGPAPAEERMRREERGRAFSSSPVDRKEVERRKWLVAVSAAFPPLDNSSANTQSLAQNPGDIILVKQTASTVRVRTPSGDDYTYSWRQLCGARLAQDIT